MVPPPMGTGRRSGTGIALSWWVPETTDADNPTSVALLWGREHVGTHERLHAVFIDHPDVPLILTLKTVPAELAPPGPPGNFMKLEDFVELARPVIESIEFEPPAT